MIKSTLCITGFIVGACALALVACTGGHPILAAEFIAANHPGVAYGVPSVIWSLAMLAALHDYYVWNNGICRKTNKPWVHFDNDSQGGRGYKSGDHTCWISYPGIDSVHA